MEQLRSLLPEEGCETSRPTVGAVSACQEPTSRAKRPTVRMQKYRSPHEAKSVSGSNSLLIKGLSARIQLHCAPSHNWESRRKELRDSVREQMAGMKSTSRNYAIDGASMDKVDRNIANAWAERMPCVMEHKRCMQREEGQNKLCQVAARREDLRQNWLASHCAKKTRLQQIREEKEAERNRTALIARKQFWLTMLWSSAVQELLGQGVQQAREKREELQNAHKQIVYIQSMVRMLLARKAFGRLKNATRMIQQGVRKFLRMLYLRRRRESAALIISSLLAMQQDSVLKKSFQRLIKSVQTLKAFLKRYSMTRDARIMVLKMQWVKWEMMHTRQPGHKRQKSTFGGTASTNTVDNAFSLIPVQNCFKHIVCRQHCTAMAGAIVRKFRLREKRRQHLLQFYEVEVLLEKCWLLETRPENSVEYRQALKLIEEDLGPVPVLKTIEPAAMISKLHRQGMRLQDKHRKQELEAQEAREAEVAEDSA